VGAVGFRCSRPGMAEQQRGSGSGGGGTCISAPPTTALCRCLPARLRRLQATMQFEPIIILSSILAVVQIILTMLPDVYYTRQVRSSSETRDALPPRRTVPRLSLPASRRPTGSSPALPHPCPPTRRARSTPPSGAGSAAWP
jgi:hypothetical protein